MKLMSLYNKDVLGAISGLDRIRFRGTLRWLANETGIRKFLTGSNVLLKDFTGWAKGITQNIKDCCDNQAQVLGIETLYLNGGDIVKEQLARQIAEKNGIEVGPICNFSAVEQCFVPQIKADKSTKKLHIKILPSKCMHLYHYFNHPEYGFGHVRFQTWAPYNIFINLNGRHWLERQLINNNIDYVKSGNCFPWIEDVQKAQELINSQLETNWPDLLNSLVGQMCPDLASILPLRPDYYWSADSTEWATDIMFRSQAVLDELYPSLIYHAMKVSDSPSVMRFLGRNDLRGKSPDEVISDCRHRYEGIRVKHWVNHNSVKMYNKSGSILRIETTINNTRDFKVFRHPDDDTSRPASWQKMRKGVSDLHRRCQISQQCNERYADTLATLEVEQKLKEAVSDSCNKVKKDGKIYRGLNPWGNEDYRLLTFLAKGENAIRGFRNKDIRLNLYPETAKMPPPQQRKYAARVSRRIKLLRVHGLVKKVAKENRYMLTSKGRNFATGLINASNIDIKRLTEIVA